MFVPLRSDRPLQATPYVNYTLILINVLVFFATFQQIDESSQWRKGFQSERRTVEGWADLDRELIEKYPVTGFFLRPDNPKLYQFFTCLFLHANIGHLLGNMIFLWMFGNNVEDRLGKVGYLLFYLTAGVFADIGHMLFSNAPVIGASGAIAGVTGMFVALFPRTRFTFLYFFFFIGAFEMPAMVVVVFYFAKDLLFWGAQIGHVAYTAHLTGNLFGFGLGMTLLLTRLLPRESYDLLSMWAHRRRRENFRKLSRSGYQAWEGKGLPGQAGGPTMTEKDRAVLETREQISRAVADHDLPRAATLFRELTQTHGTQVLSQRNQLDIANQLYAEQDYALAAQTYEQLLKTYPRHPDRGPVQLVLGLTYARHLSRPADARPLLQEASQRLHGEDAKLARELLAEVG